ncbi:hypothetical protein [Brucella rhizosphaerae]|uniref:Uncharacterized protein n=1 Tax=Brucella rhizosphaerae TaxID=571254 RepID=A0A256FLB8_9HYPH|nr:hypothetical protein [Brucella rhizosphaerae]OYR15550.1 hypothetical protein CEV32_4826 [Brucella rhizosphaerae]
MLIVHDVDGRILFISTYHAADDYEDALTEQCLGFIRYDQPCDASKVVATHFVEDGSLKERPSISIAKTTVKVGELIEVSGLRGKATIQIDDEEYSIEDETLNFEAEYPGEYVIKVDAWPCLPFEAQVNVE